MYKYLFMIIILSFLLSCDNRNSSGPDYVFEEVFTEHFDEVGDWILNPDYTTMLGDTAWVVVDDGQLQMGALYGWNVPSAGAFYNYNDSLTQIWTEKNVLFEIKVINAGVSEVGDVSYHLFFNNDIITISFDSYGLFDYSNYILHVDYEQEYNSVTILVNGIELNSYQINEPGGLFRIMFDLWTSSANGNGSALLNIDYVKIFTYCEEE